MALQNNEEALLARIRQASAKDLRRLRRRAARAGRSGSQPEAGRTPEKQSMAAEPEHRSNGSISCIE
jgi:hypothetical protein